MTSPTSGFFNRIIFQPACCVWETSVQLSERTGLTKAAQVGFNFFKSYGDAPKDLAKAFQVMGEWVVIICEKKGALNGLNTAQKVATFAKQAKCFLSFSGICSQLVKAKDALASLIRPQQVMNGELPGAHAQQRRGFFTVRSVKTLIEQGSGLCASAFDSITLLSVLGIMSSKNKYLPAIKIGACVATILGASMRLGSDTGGLYGEYAQGRFRSRNNWENAISLTGNAAILVLGAIPLLINFKGYKPTNNLILKLGTISVLSTLINKHIPRSLA
ncbi:MAG: hypothetical protein ACRDDW_03920 [Candidatus Rhabdochlamydia sp.]